MSGSDRRNSVGLADPPSGRGWLVRWCGVESVRKWVARAEIYAGARAGVTSAESLELKGLRRQNRELRRANEIVWRAATFFAGGARLSTAMTVRFVDQNRDEFRG